MVVKKLTANWTNKRQVYDLRVINTLLSPNKSVYAQDPFWDDPGNTPTHLHDAFYHRHHSHCNFTSKKVCCFEKVKMDEEESWGRETGTEPNVSLVNVGDFIYPLYQRRRKGQSPQLCQSGSALRDPNWAARGHAVKRSDSANAGRASRPLPLPARSYRN